MASKSKKPAAAASASKKSNSGGAREEEEHQDPLQAVILTEFFETRFAPLTLERPRCLLPVANAPLIEYTLEFLANAGVEEIFVYCSGVHKEAVADYIQHSKWPHKSSPFSAVHILRSTARSVGDAMRDLDKRGLLKHDFFIVYGDIISNLQLTPALEEHRKRRVTDKNAIMTMVLREAKGEHISRELDSPVFAVDPRKDRCLHYESLNATQDERFVELDQDALGDKADVELRADLVDCGIDICTPDVLALWSDNFDFQTARENFLYSVLKDYELNGKTIHTHIVRENYVARVQSPRAYDSISKEVISRWAYPFDPSSNLLRDQAYILKKGNVYEDQNIFLSNACDIGKNTVLGPECSIGDGSSISSSVIGERCIIGRNVVIVGAYIWHDAVIGDGSIIKQAIVANEAVVGKNCTLEAGAILSYGVRIADGTTVKGTTRITRMKRKREVEGETEEELTRAESDPRIVGVNGDGIEFIDSEDEDEGEDNTGDYFRTKTTSHGLVYNLASLSLSSDSISTLNSTSSHDTNPIIPTSNRDRSSASSFVSATSDDDNEENDARTTHFHHEAASSIYDSLLRGDDSANIQLELNALRLSTNASEHAVRRAVVAAFGKYITILTDPAGPHALSITAAVDKALPAHKKLLSRIVFDKTSDAKPDQVDLLLLLQADLAKRRDGDSILLFAAKELVQLEVLEAEALEQWWEDAKSSEGEEMARVRAKTKTLVDFLCASDEEESSEEEESDEE